MKVVFLTACNSRSAGGLYFTITEYTKALSKLGLDVEVIAFNDQFSKEDIMNYGDVPMKAYDRVKFPILESFGYSRNLLDILEDSSPDIIHLQGLWMYHSWAAKKFLKKHPNTKLIIEPHGMLDPWALKNSAWKKKIVGLLFENWNLKRANCMHALCESEYESIRNYNIKIPTAIMPNGITLPQYYEKRRIGPNTLLFISRIHPKKGLELLIDAIAKLNEESDSNLSEWCIRIAGWDQNGHRKYLENKVKLLGLSNIITFIGPVFGDRKIEELVNADAFILPSYSEGLPMSILEAWSFKLPVIMTDFCNLPEGFSSSAALRIGLSADSIASNLRLLFSMSDLERNALGKNGYQLVKEKFTWNVIANDTLRLYDFLMGQNSKPDFVYE